jgi:Tol biopolymer transport system component
LLEHQITANPSEDWVTDGAISPDGKTVAYHDQTGLYLRSVDSGEIRPVPLPPGFHEAIFSMSWFPEGKRLLVAESSSAMYEPGYADFWVVSTTGESAPRLLLQDAFGGSISPNGGSLAFIRRELKVAGINDTSERTLRAKPEANYFVSPVWSPDGRWLAYVRLWTTAQAYHTAIEVQPAAGGEVKAILSEGSLPKGTSICDLNNSVSCLTWSPDWRLFFSARPDGSPSADPDYSLWEVSTQPGNVEATTKPNGLAHWRDFGFANPSLGYVCEWTSSSLQCSPLLGG